MKKIILVDGNNLIFRSYYATAYNGNFMKNTKGFPTNALYGFINMINKIINEENPQYILVAFDKGKTFRHEKYKTYKDGRNETPIELKQQFPLAKQLLTAMGIKYYEIDNYEADDIIGTFSEYCNQDPNYTATIISSDKDLLQLITKDVSIKLLKQKDYIRYNQETFKEDYGIDPINIIDLKALMGDPSDNILGVKGIGEKTALKLLHQYKTLDGIYENINTFTGKLKEKLINDKQNAYMSYELATIIKNVPVEISLTDIEYKQENQTELNKLYEELEFYSFLKKTKQKEEKQPETKIITNINELDITSDIAVCLETLGKNYHTSQIIGMGIYNPQISAFIPLEILKQNPDFLTKTNKYTYDIKKITVALKHQNIETSSFTFDTMIAGELLDYNTKEDMAYLAGGLGHQLEFHETLFPKQQIPDQKTIAKACIQRAKFIYDTKKELQNKLKEEKLEELYENIELPLTTVLADMEITGVKIDQNKLISMGEEIQTKIKNITNEIYTLANCEFNIASPKQLSEILYEKLNLPHGKKTTSGYSTAAGVLQKLKDKHPIIPRILEYRSLSKLYGTYIEGLQNYITNQKIHTIYTQNLTRTGRLSSIEPNLQNIPVRDEIGKKVRKAFIPENDYILSADYSQIELRILAHIAKVPALKQAFKEDLDIHTKTASDIFKVPIELVTKDMRRAAKAVNFGIIYGISGFGLGENLDIKKADAKKFIDTYLQTYPGIKDYMENMVDIAKKQGYVRTMFNRKRNIPELKNPVYTIRQSGERIALNTPIQGTSADIIKLAMIKVQKAFKENNLKSKMIIQVHDELIFDIKKEELEKVKQIVIDNMENICKLEVPLKIDINYGKNWFEAK